VIIVTLDDSSSNLGYTLEYSNIPDEDVADTDMEQACDGT